MKKKYLLASLAFLNLGCLYGDNGTDHVLLHMLKEKDQDTKQDVLKLIKTIKRLETQTNGTLTDYQKALTEFKSNLQDILDNYSSSLDLANQVIFTQQDLLNDARQANLVKACAITGLLSCLATCIIMMQYKNGKFSEIVNGVKSGGWFSFTGWKNWARGTGPIVKQAANIKVS